jgi:hypothetical protein
MGFLSIISLLGKIYDIRYIRAFILMFWLDLGSCRKFSDVLYCNLSGE